jgi:hypothetical protein
MTRKSLAESWEERNTVNNEDKWANGIKQLRGKTKIREAEQDNKTERLFKKSR